MRKKENFLEVHVKIENKKRDSGWIGRYGDFFLAYLYLSMAVTSFFLIYSSVFGIPYKKGTFFAGTLLICLFGLLLYVIPPAKIRIPVICAIFVVWAFTGFRVWDKLKPGAYSALEVIIDKMNEFYKTAWVIEGENVGTIGQNTGFLLFMMVPLVLILGAGIVRKFRWWVLAVVFLIPIGGAMLVGQMPSIFSLLLLLLSMLVVFSGKRAKMAGFMGKQAAFGMICMALPVALISGLLLVPVSRIYEKNDYFSSVKEYFNQEVWPYFEDLGEKLPFGGSGGAVDGRLNRGELDFDGTKELRVTIDYQPESAIYLKGYVGDTYTGEEWEAVDGGALLDYAKAEGWAYEEELSRMVSDMTYEMLNSGIDLTYQEQHMTMERVHASRKYAYLPYYAKADEKYEIDGDGTVQGLLSEVSQIDYCVVDEKEMYDFDLDQLDADALDVDADYVDLLKEYKAYVYENYLDYPAERLSRLEQQCRDNPQGSIREIRDYIVSTLKNTTSYDINTPAFPKEEEFVEYFLYTQKTGYCVHYASAAVLMFRMYGVPARFVGGYIAPANTFFENGDGTYTAELMDDMTHAWVEIYTDLGWVPVEVTPPYEGANWAGHMDSAEETPEETPEPTVTEIITVTPTEDGENLVNTEEIGNTTATPEPTGSPTPTESVTPVPSETAVPEASEKNGDASAGETEKEISVLNIVLYAAVGAVVLSVLVLIINLAVRRILLRIRFHSTDYNSNIRYIYHYLYKALQFDQFPKEIRVSDTQFAHHLVKQYPRISVDETERFAKQVLRANYSSDKMTAVECMEARIFYRKVCKEISERSGLLRRIQFRVIKGF